MEVQITIRVIPEDPDRFNKDELERDIVFQFRQITGYEVDEISIDKYM